MILRIGNCYSHFLFCKIVILFMLNFEIVRCKRKKDPDPEWINPDMKSYLEEARIIPDVLDEAPKYELKVQFGDGDNAIVDFGNYLHPNDLTDELSIRINTTAEHDGYYFLIMTDIDYPSPDSPERTEYIHWMALNIRCVDIKDGDVATAYAPPGTNIHGPGIHRYMFYYIKQRSCGPVLDYFDYALPLNKPERSKRKNFSVNRFRMKWGLQKPTAVNFFRINWEAAEE